MTSVGIGHPTLLRRLKRLRRRFAGSRKCLAPKLRPTFPRHATPERSYIEWIGSEPKVDAVNTPQPADPQPRGRVCSRTGCGRLIVAPDGQPAYNRHFCNEACRRADKRERMQQKRRKATIGRCPQCGRKLGDDRLADGRVPRHNASLELAVPPNGDRVELRRIVR